MKKVFIYDELAYHNPHSGMGLYTSEITKYLKKNKRVDYQTFHKPETNFGKNFFGKILTVIHELTFLQFKGTVILIKKKADSVYIPNPPVPFFLPRPIVLTIPDMAFFYENISLFTKCYLFIIYFLSAKKAYKITTFSQNSKKDIVRLLRVSSEKVVICAPALKDSFIRLLAKETSIKPFAKYKISGKYILTVPGTYVKRKNMDAVLRAFLSLPDKLQNGLRIVSVGRTGDRHHGEFVKKIKSHGVKNKFIFLSNVSDAELVMLYKNAEVLLFPSLYEGFGLPPLEALACACPCLVLNNSSFPEVVGGGGMLMENEKELEKGLLKVLTNKRYRANLVKKGKNKYKKFSWGKSSKELNLWLTKN